MSEPFQPGSERKKEKAKPVTIPGKLMTSGIIWWSMSMNVMTTRLEQRMNKAKNVKVGPNLMKSIKVRRPLINSTRG
jgi:hypothetical protein